MTRELKNYLPGNNLAVPGTDGKYMLHVAYGDNGQALDVVLVPSDNMLDRSNWIAADENGLLEVEVFGMKAKVSREWLVCFTHKPLYESTSFHHKLEVGFSNGSKRDFRPKNLFWIIPEGGIEDPNKPGFFIPPAYSRHSLSKEGVIWSRRTNTFGTIRPSGNGKGNVYQNTSVADCLGEIKTVGMHRLLAMAFLRTEIDPDKLTVNHVVGTKKFNAVVDLEWATYRKNNLHAKDTLLQKTRHPCLARDYIRGTIYRFNSKSAAAFFYGINTGNVVESCKFKRIIREHLEFRNDDGSPAEWNEKFFQAMGLDTTLPEVEDRDENSRRVCLYIVDTRDLLVFNTHYELVDHLGVDTRTVVRALSQTFKQVIDGKLICYVNEAKELISRIDNGQITYTDTRAFERKPVTVEVTSEMNPEKINSLTFSGVDRATEALFPNETADFLVRNPKAKYGFQYGEHFYRVVSGI